MGALLFDERVRAIVPPLSGRTALLRLIARVEREAQDPASSTNLGRALTEAGRLIRKPSLVIVITDFMTADGWQRPLSSLAMRHEVIAAWVTDPRERDIPDVGVVTFEDPESGQQILVDTGNARLRLRFESAADTQRIFAWAEEKIRTSRRGEESVAPLKVVEVMRDAIMHGDARGYDDERRAMIELRRSASGQKLLSAFFEQQASKKSV